MIRIKDKANADKNLIEQIAESLGVSNRLARLLTERGVNSVEEARKFYDKGIKTKPLLGGIGYKELYEYFDNKTTLEEATEKIKQNSRHYAKRQFTFFKNQMDIKWFNVNFDNFNDILSIVSKSSIYLLCGNILLFFLAFVSYTLSLLILLCFILLFIISVYQGLCLNNKLEKNFNSYALIISVLITMLIMLFMFRLF